MHRIDHSTASAALPAPKPPGAPGYFSNGNPQTGVERTIVSDDWCNAVQEEIANVIEASGIGLTKGDNDQMVTAIVALIQQYASEETEGDTTPDATTTIKGKVELATPAEAVEGESDTLVVTPAGLAAALALLGFDVGVGTLQIGAFLLQTGSGVAPTSNAQATSSPVNFVTPYETLWHVSLEPDIATVAQMDYLVAHAATNRSGAGFLARFNVNEGVNNPDKNIIRPVPYTWIAFGVVAAP